MIPFTASYFLILDYALYQKFFLLNFNRFQLLKCSTNNILKNQGPKNFSRNDLVNRGKTPKNREFLLGHSWANLPKGEGARVDARFSGAKRILFEEM